jgi:hypothetical protein
LFQYNTIAIRMVLPLFLGGGRGGKKNSTVLLPSPPLPINREGVDPAKDFSPNSYSNY